MKKLLIFCVLFVLLFLTGCEEKPYEFINQVDEIENIEIVSVKSIREFTVIKTLSDTQRTEFLEKFQEIMFSRYLFGDPLAVHGDGVKITYKNGEYEIICAHVTEYVWGDTEYFVMINCDKEEFSALRNSFLENVTE